MGLVGTGGWRWFVGPPPAVPNPSPPHHPLPPMLFTWASVSPLARGDVPTGSLMCGWGWGGSTGPVAGGDEGTATLHHGDARPQPSFPRRKPGRLLAARNNGIREESGGGESLHFFPSNFHTLDLIGPSGDRSAV